VSENDNNTPGERMSALEFVDLFCPEHSRTSCDDQQLQNGWGSYREGGARCNRCGFLDAIQNGSWPEWASVSISFDRPMVKVERMEPAAGDSPVRTVKK
jgi:hypothetical protein